MRQLPLLLCSAAILFATACQKQPAESTLPTVDATQSARQAYEQQKSQLPQTKTGNLADIVRPLPGDFSPVWADAVEHAAGGSTYVTVPISSATAYTATFPCQDHDVATADEHGSAHHHEHPVMPVIQKLAVRLSGDSATCYILNVVPFEECTLTAEALDAGFNYGADMAGFTGFAAYHHFDGSLAYIDGFEAGSKVAQALPADNGQLSAVTRDAQLSVIDLSDPGIIERYVEPFDPTDPDRNKICELCFSRCFSPYTYEVFDVNTTDGWAAYTKNLKNKEKHCDKCKELKTECICPDPPSPPYPPQNPCYFCGKNNCTLDHVYNPWTCAYCGIICDNRVDPRQTPEIVHGDFLRNQFGCDRIPYADLHNFQQGCYYVDKYRNGSGEEYLHNLILPNEKFEVAYNKLRNYFISVVKEAKNDNPTYMPRLGEAMHPVLDLYISNDKRMSMLNYYAYPTYGSIIPRGLLNNQSWDIQTMYDAIKALPRYCSDAQVGAIFDAWAQLELK